MELSEHRSKILSDQARAEIGVLAKQATPEGNPSEESLQDGSAFNSEHKAAALEVLRRAAVLHRENVHAGAVVICVYQESQGPIWPLRDAAVRNQEDPVIGAFLKYLKDFLAST